MAPLRAAGLCLELALKVGFSQGFCSVSEESLQTVELHGQDLHTRAEEGGWQKKTAVTLDLIAKVVAFTLSAYSSLVAVVHRLGMNIVAVDKVIPGGNGYHDLVVSYITPKRLVDGLLSVEVKVRRGGRTFTKAVEGIKKDMEARFRQLQKLPSQSPFQGVLLIVCQAAGAGCALTGLLVQLFDGESWAELSSSLPTTRSAAKAHIMKPIGAILKDIMWLKHPKTGGQVGMVSSFVKAVGKSKCHVGARVALWNKLLLQAEAEQAQNSTEAGQACMGGHQACL